MESKTEPADSTMLSRNIPLASITQAESAPEGGVHLHENTYIDVSPAVKLGVGINSLTSAIAGDCLERSPLAKCNEAGKRVVFTKRFVSNATRMREALGISFAASYGSGFISAAASAAFSSSSEMKSDSAYLYLDVEVTLGATTIDARLTPAALTRLHDDPALFIGACGDSYVATVESGAHYRVIYEFKHLTEYSKRDLDASLSVGGPNWNTDTEFRRSLEHSLDRFETQLFVSQRGGQFERTPMSIDKLIDKAERFVTDVTCSNADSASAVTKSYYSANNFPSGIRVLDLDVYKRELESLAPDYDNARVMTNDITERLTSIDRLSDTACIPDKRKLEEIHSSLKLYTTAARKKADACFVVSNTGPGAACLVALTAPSNELPQLSDPLHCGPQCTERVGSSYVVDNHGYCDRCTWEPRSAIVGPVVTSMFESECRFMHRGSRVLVRATGILDPMLKSDEGDAWAIFSLSGTSGNQTFACSTESADCFFNRNYIYGPAEFSFSEYAFVNRTSELGTLAAHITANMCQKTYGRTKQCAYNNVRIDVCDVSTAGGCGTPIEKAHESAVQK